MQIGLFMNTHGLGIRDDDDWWLQPVPAKEMRPVKVAQLAERVGFHSVWFSDHVAMPPAPKQITYANPESAKRHYPPRPNMMDGAVVMGAVASNTSTIKMSPSVLIAPYRQPLSDARQFATIDVLSNGRVIMGVGVGWCREEFEALGIPFEERVTRTVECMEIYKRAWTQELVEFSGQHYNFSNLYVDPKPVQEPHPPIVLGAVTPLGARLAARHADGFYPIFLSPRAQPEDYNPLQDEMRREAEKAGRDLSQFALLGCVSCHITSADHPDSKQSPRRICAGTPEQILSDLERFAEAGYCLVNVHFDCPSVKVEELEEQIEQFGREVMPTAKGFKPKGEWRKEL